jgi:Uma2 family endonuclease
VIEETNRMSEIEMPEIEVKPHLFTVEEYMASNVPGHTELVGGTIYDVSPSNPAHIHAVEALLGYFMWNLDRETYRVRPSHPLALDGWAGRQAPEPDIAVVRQGDYRERLPTAGEAFVVIEVSDSTYLFDRNVKIPLYAAAGIPAWIVNIRGRRVEHYLPYESNADPRCYLEDDTFDILGVPIRVSDLLP